MGSSQFNNWEPVLDPVNGRMQQEPRVFAHDASTITIGAVNTTAANEGISSLAKSGAGYPASATGAGTSVTPAGGSGLTVDITVESGTVVDVKVNNPGSGYSVGDVIKIIGGTIGQEATFTITNIDIPNSAKRGVCLYVGVGGDIEVELESGQTVTFKGVAAGSFMPVLAKRLISGQAAVGDILALY